MNAFSCLAGLRVGRLDELVLRTIILKKLNVFRCLAGRGAGKPDKQALKAIILKN